MVGREAGAAPVLARRQPTQLAAPGQGQGLRKRLAARIPCGSWRPAACGSARSLTLCALRQAEAGDLRERLADAARQRQADEEMIGWLNTQARAGHCSCAQRTPRQAPDQRCAVSLYLITMPLDACGAVFAPVIGCKENRVAV